MIYIVKGSEPHFIKDKLDALIRESNGEVVKFDGNSKNFTIEELVDSCMSNSLFADKLCVICKDPYFLTKKVEEKEISVLLDYISNPVYETDLIFYTLDDNFNIKLKTYKTISENSEVITLDGLDYKNFNNYCYSRIKEEDLIIDKDSAYTLISICKRNASLFNSNLEILKLYPDKIDQNVIAKLCTSSDNNLVFDLINAICEKDINKTIICERKLLSESDSILGVIALLSNSLRQTYFIGYLLEKGYKKSQIINECKSSEFIINKSIDTLSKIKKEQILKLLSQLSDLDIECKSNYDIPDNSRFELFILNLLEDNKYAKH